MPARPRIAVAMLVLSFAMLFAINLLQALEPPARHG